MKYRGIFEYEYPREHKPPVSIDVHLHGDCVKGKIIEWEYRPLEQEPCEDKIIEWKKDFKGYVNSLSMPRDDYKGIMEYIDELPVTPQPKTGK